MNIVEYSDPPISNPVSSAVQTYVCEGDAGILPQKGAKGRLCEDRQQKSEVKAFTGVSDGSKVRPSGPWKNTTGE